MFESIFKNSTSVAGISTKEFVICLVAALIIGVFISLAYMLKNEYSKSFVVTLALLPCIVSAVIIMVNGNLGAGVAVAGTFSLVRFRSAQGTAKEICSIFLAMAVGLSCGMGFIGYALILAILVCLANIVYNLTKFGEKKRDMRVKDLKITIPEELDYTSIFDDLFENYTDKCGLVAVKTTNMGSMYKLSYNIKLKNEELEKEFIDKLRARNGNLEVLCSRSEFYNNEL